LELGQSPVAQISFNDANVRTLAGDTTAGSPVQMPSDFYGKASTVTLTVTYNSSGSNFTLDAGSLSGYVAGKTQVNVTINSGVVISATSTSVAALTITGFASGDTVSIVNNGTIAGAGGAAGANGSGAGTSPYPGNPSSVTGITYPSGYTGTGYPTGYGAGGSTPGYNYYSGGGISASAGSNGGPAITLASNIALTITNNGTIVGGGGGGGGQAGNNAGGGAGGNGGLAVNVSGSAPTITLNNASGAVVASGGGASGGWGNRYANDGIGGKPGFGATHLNPSGSVGGNYGGDGTSPGVSSRNSTALINTAGTFSL
jgi:hypothetical protein